MSTRTEALYDVIRLVRPLGYEAKREAAERRAGKEPKKTDRQELGEYLLERVAAMNPARPPR